MKEGIAADTRVYALLGDPVEHSLSPRFQNAGFTAAAVNGVYVALRCSDGDVAPLMGALARAGGGGNVTLPHKERAARVLDRASEAVRRTGACNTFWGRAGLLHGDNTDVEGFGRALRAFRGGEPRGHRVLLLGAGGAARAVLVALSGAGAAQVVILNRTVERARRLAGEAGGRSVQVVEGPDSLEGEAFDLVVNATRLGLSPDDPHPVDLDRLGSVGAVFDLVYGQAPPPFIAAARERGIPATDGLEMLLQQGAVAFERWWGREAPVEAMRGALHGEREDEA